MNQQHVCDSFVAFYVFILITDSETYLPKDSFFLLIPGDVQLLGLTVRGQIQSIKLPIRRQDTGLSRPPSLQVGHSVGDLLSAIGDVCER